MRALYCAAAFTFLIPSVARTQTFAKVVITPSVATDQRESRLQVLPNGDLIGHSIPVIELLSLAYDVPDNPSVRVSSLPEWAAVLRFDMEAKVSISLRLDSKDIAIQKRTAQRLIQQLLSDCFGLVLRVRTERMPVYALFVAKGDPKLNRAAIGTCVFDTSSEGCHSFQPGFGHPLNARAADMSDLAHYVGNWTDVPVVDRTALTGVFRFHTEGWKPMNLPPPPPGTPASGDEFATLPPLSVILGGLGLELRRQEDNLPLYMVERIHQPNAK